MRRKRIAEFTFLLFVLTFNFSPVHAHGPENPLKPNPPSVNPWTDIASSLQSGTSRQEVEKVLPPLGPPVHRIIADKSHTLIYFLDCRWVAKIRYDFHGALRDKSGNTISCDSNKNRLLEPVQFEAAKLPFTVHDRGTKIPIGQLSIRPHETLPAQRIKLYREKASTGFLPILYYRLETWPKGKERNLQRLTFSNELLLESITPPLSAVDVTGDGFLDLRIAGGATSAGKAWYRTLAYHPQTAQFRWLSAK